MTSDEHENDDRLEFTYSPSTFPFHPDCYTWPRIAMYDENGATELNVHCLRDTKRRRFSLVGFIGAHREDQISAVIFLAQQAGAEVIVFRGVGIDDQIVGKLMASMVELDPEESPDQLTACVPVDWPTRFQRRVLQEAVDMGGRGDFHEETLAKRMHAPLEEIRKHLQLLADIGLVSEAP